MTLQLDFHTALKILFAVHLKYSSFGTLVGIKPILNVYYIISIKMFKIVRVKFISKMLKNSMLE